MPRSTKTGFRPVRGEEEQILATGYNEGWVYFATDTGKIFIDANGEEKIVMGGSGASLFYSNAPANRVIENPEGTYTLPFNSLDDSKAQPKEDDFLVNIPTGSFYRVLDANEDSGIECSLIAVSGSGSGGVPGGGSGDSPSGPSALLTLELLDGSFPTTFVYQQDSFVNFKATATDDSLISVVVKVIGSTNTTSYSYTVNSGEDFSLNIGQLLFPGTNSITITALGENSGSATKKYSNRNCISLGLQASTSFNPLQVFDGACSFSCIPSGSGLEKTLKVFVDGVLSASAIIAATISNRTYTIDIPEQTHGAHEVEVVLTTTANGIEMKTEPLKYELAWRDDHTTTPIIWIPNGYNKSITNYDTVAVEYMIYDPTADTTEARFYKESIEEPTSPQSVTYSSTRPLTWDLTDYEVGTNNYTISAGNGSVSKNFVLYVAEDESRDMNIVNTAIVLNLDSSGRSNNEVASSRETWTYTNLSNVTTAVKFNDFNWYNNGWILDENNKSCLRISNGASIEIPLAPLNILNSTKLSNGYTFEFRFKVRNINEYATLIQRDTSNVDSEDTVAGWETERGVFGKFYSALGFCLGTQEAFLRSSNSLVSAKYKEDEIVNVSFVIENKANYPLMYIYINGVMSGIKNYGSSDSFESNASTLIFNSKYCDVDLYSVRIYTTALNHSDILHNYIADEKNVVEYDANQIVGEDGTSIDYNLMLEYNLNHPSNPIMPYAVIKTTETDDMLPYVKGGKKAVSVKFVNPYLDYLWDNELIDGTTYLHGCPSYESDAGTVTNADVQGTSSQGYPRRNFKIKFKGLPSWTYTNGPLAGESLLEPIEYEGKIYKNWYMDHEIGESTFTWKADYMDSSRAHNSGLASYIQTLYSKHPIKDYGVDDTGLRTTIYGFPMIVFQEKHDGSVDFVGLYNYNLDKSCKDTFGYTVGKESNVLSYSEMKPEKFDASVALEKDEDGNYHLTSDVSYNPEKTYYVEGRKTFKKVSECWEFCDNQGTYCSFRNPDFTITNDTYSVKVLSSATYEPGIYYTATNVAGVVTYSISDGPFDASETYYIKEVGPLAVNSSFEYRYHPDADDIDDCLDGAGDFAAKTQEERNAYMLKKYKNLQKVSEWVYSTEHDLDKFKNEFSEHFDLEYCIVYFIATELLHLYDSRGKNLMLATWGPKKVGGNYIWYPTFYDMDTQLGINNSGVPSWDYYAEPTEGNQFSTSNSILWNNLYAAFKQQIMDTYVKLRKNNLSLTKLDGYYRFDPEVTKSYAMHGKRPQVLQNFDEYWKYIAPTMVGFYNTSGVMTKDDGSFFYCLQGTRDLQRYLYLRNRFNYIDSKWAGGSYATEAAKNEFWARIDGSNGAQTSDNYLFDPAVPEGTTKEADGVTYTYTANWPVALDATPNFEITSFLKQYIHGQYDENHTTPLYSNGIDSVVVEAPADTLVQYQKTPALTQQLIYFGGGEYIADMGDLGLKYIDELHIPTLKRLETLKLGSDVVFTDSTGEHPYFNNQLNSTNLHLNMGALDSEGKVNTNAKTLMREMILTGLTALDGSLDLTGSEKLQIFRALRTKISGVEFADGVQLHTLHLPETLTSLHLIEPTSLTGTVASPTTESGEFAKGLYIEGLTDKVGNNTVIPSGTETAITKYNIVGGSLGYGSYKLLRTLVTIKDMMIASEKVKDGNSKYLGVNLENVEWSPYAPVQYGEDHLLTVQYYFDNGRYGFVPYEYTTYEAWQNDTLNGKVYTYNNLLFAKEYSTVEDLNILDTFIANYEDAMAYYSSPLHYGDKSLNYYRSTSDTATTPTLPVLTGRLYVNNTTPIDEAELFNKYHKYFPDLTIFCKNVTEGYMVSFVSVIDGKESPIEVQRYSKASGIVNPALPQVQPIRLNYNFLGWSLTDGGAVLSDDEILGLTFDNEHTVYKLYAIYEISSYNITFYNADGETVLATDLVPYGTRLSNPAILPSTDESGLSDTKRYRFAGWVTDKADCFQKSATTANAKVVNLTAIVSQNMDRQFYACYYEEDATISATANEFFTFNVATFNDEIDSAYNAKGYDISPAKGYQLSGKITLPTTYNGQPIISISGFTNQTEITHIYFAGVPQVRRVSRSAFAGCAKLKVFTLPSTLRYIAYGAFQECSNLDIFDLEKTKGLYYIGDYAFNKAFKTAAPVPVFTIPGNVVQIGDYALSFNGEVNGGFLDLHIGSSDSPTKLTKIGNRAVIQNPENMVQHVTIYLEKMGSMSQALYNAVEGSSPNATGYIQYSGGFDVIALS